MNLAGIRLVDYETIVRDMAKKDSDELIDNDSVHHVKMVSGTLLCIFLFFS